MASVCANPPFLCVRSVFGSERDGVGVVVVVQGTFCLLMCLFYVMAVQVRSNACYAMGLLCEFGGNAMHPQYMAILQGLHPLFTQQPTPEVMDNACGAVSRMIMAAPAQLPLDKVFPVLLTALPLKKDFVENETVFKMLLSLFRVNNQEV